MKHILPIVLIILFIFSACSEKDALIASIQTSEGQPKEEQPKEERQNEADAPSFSNSYENGRIDLSGNSKDTSIGDAELSTDEIAALNKLIWCIRWICPEYDDTQVLTDDILLCCFSTYYDSLFAYTVDEISATPYPIFEKKGESGSFAECVVVSKEVANQFAKDVFGTELSMVDNSWSATWWDDEAFVTYKDGYYDLCLRLSDGPSILASSYEYLGSDTFAVAFDVVVDGSLEEKDADMLRVKRTNTPLQFTTLAFGHTYVQMNAEHRKTISGADYTSDAEYDTSVETFVLQGKDRNYTKKELLAYNQQDIAYIRNGMYALSGKIFTTPVYIEFFSNQVWYKPTKANVDHLLNEHQIYNIALCVEIEKENGWR